MYLPAKNWNYLAHSTGYFYLSFSFQRGKNNSENHPLK
jgi:hypothetical protein